MGLDMYSNKRTYVRNGRTKARFTGEVGDRIKAERVTYIEEQVAYWRKANQIHKWFIDNCGDGDENSMNIEVSTNNLKDLVATCEKVLEGSNLVKGKIPILKTFNGKGEQEIIFEEGGLIENPELAEKLLPTQSGFFFGSTEYDQYYLDDLKETVAQLKPLIEEDPNAWYRYEPSW